MCCTDCLDFSKAQPCTILFPSGAVTMAAGTEALIQAGCLLNSGVNGALGFLKYQHPYPDVGFTVSFSGDDTEMPFSSPISLLVEALTVDGLTPGLRVTTDGTEPSAHTFSSEITGPIQLNFSSNAIVKIASFLPSGQTGYATYSLEFEESSMVDEVEEPEDDDYSTLSIVSWTTPSRNTRHIITYAIITLVCTVAAILTIVWIMKRVWGDDDDDDDDEDEDYNMEQDLFHSFTSSSNATESLQHTMDFNRSADIDTIQNLRDSITRHRSATPMTPGKL
eukprot:TRINITY_DN905_c0_g1_i2.p1 TRINITY_DN905_c0_g1~~TRINITY_DN905_c0_g1_i2.p1  ORF type:complete len:279 (-),score=48.43 TRINITY_DN905_c0_g1_i2:53-889(-)